MKTLRLRTFFVFALAGLSGAMLLHVSQNVQQAEEKARTLELSIAREQEKIQVLQAEWAHLTRPERLEALAQDFLGFVPPAPDRIVGRSPEFEDSDPGTSVVEYPDDYEGGEVYLQPVSLDGDGAAKIAPPKPPVKPIFARPPKRVEQPLPERKEKAFGDLLNELGGGQ